MKILTNHPRPALLQAVTHLLVQTLAVDARRVWLVTPWLKDVRLPLGEVGHYASLLGGQREEIGLAALLAFVARRHALCVVTKPPGELVDFRLLKRLSEKVESKRHVLGAPDLRGYSILEELAIEFDRDIADLADAALTHAETIHLGLALRSQGAQLHYLDRLHAKLLWTPIGAVVGSANFTNGGLISNEELMLEATDPAVHGTLDETARQFLARSRPSEDYRLASELERAGLLPRTIGDLAGSPALGLYPGLQQLLSNLAHFIR